MKVEMKNPAQYEKSNMKGRRIRAGLFLYAFNGFLLLLFFFLKEK